MNILKEEWDAYRHRRFPPGSASLDPAGVCLAYTDTLAGGCITTYLGREALDQERIDVLRKCVADLERALPETKGEMLEHFSELKKIAQGVLDAVAV
jgi:hypothetical protein